MTELRIGIPDHDRALGALRDADALTGLATWVVYGDHTRTIDLLATGDLHVAATGALPPLRARSEGVDVVYLAADAPVPVRARVVVRAGSTIDGIDALRGRRVAMERGTAPTLALTTLLDRESPVAYRHVQPVLLPAELGRRALLDGHADAWLDTRPGASLGPALRELPGTTAEVTDQTIWFARRDITVDRPDLITTLLGAITATPITRTFLADQQRLGDLLAAQGAIGLPVNVGACAAA
jgi:sulfonate transport system substrate-binding protein